MEMTTLLTKQEFGFRVWWTLAAWVDRTWMR